MFLEGLFEYYLKYMASVPRLILVTIDMYKKETGNIAFRFGENIVSVVVFITLV